MEKKALGKGLQALLPTNPTDTKENGIFDININDIEPNPNQPRKVFDEESLYQLAQSIKDVGVLQPVIVKKEGGIHRIVAGERRWRAARIAGLKTIPVITKELSDLESVEISLIENLQREDLNPIEEAQGYEYLIDEYQMTQDQISELVCKSRSAVANSLRLLKLSKNIQELLRSKKISPGHGRALLSIEDDFARERLAEEITISGLSVRQIEELVKDADSMHKYASPEGSPENKKRKTPFLDERALALERIESSLKNLLGTNVKMVSSGEKGRIIINYYDEDHLQRILEMLGLNDTNSELFKAF